MIDHNIPGKVTCKGRPNFLIIQRFEDWLFDCACLSDARLPVRSARTQTGSQAMAREAQANQIAQDASAAPAQLVAEVEEVMS